MWHLNAFHCLPAAEPYFAEYPPGIQIFQYLLQALHGSFSEWRINAAHMTYVFALYLPFLTVLKYRNVLQNLLTAAVVFCSGTIIYAYALDNLMVDFALSATFAYGMGRVFLLQRKDGFWDRFDLMHIIMACNMLILIKSAGKLLAVLVLLALVITMAIRYGNERLRPFNCAKKAILFLTAFIFPLITGVLWKLKYSYYQTHVAFEAHYDLREFLQILAGHGEGYRVAIKGAFLSFLTYQQISVGFLTLTNIQLVLLLFGLVLLLRYHYSTVKTDGQQVAVGVLLLGFFVYLSGLMASYFYAFSEAEGTALASMQRYLNIYYCAMLLFSLFLFLSADRVLRWAPKLMSVILIGVLCFASYADISNMLDRNCVETSIAQRQPFQVLEDQIRTDPHPKQEHEKNCVMLVYQDGYPHNPVNQFTYMLWPDYQVPWECSYGSEKLFEDAYTYILTEEEYFKHVLELGTDYIGIALLNEDFVNTYQSLFDHPLKNGQVYKVDENAAQFELLQIQEG